MVLGTVMVENYTLKFRGGMVGIMYDNDARIFFFLRIMRMYQILQKFGN